MGLLYFAAKLPEVIMRKLCLLLALALVGVMVSSSWADHRSFEGEAAYYSNYYEGRTMACGGKYQSWKMVAAHRTLPCGTRLRVKNKANGEVVRVTVKDRGPYGDENRVLDLSRRAARKLGYINAGIARVRAVILHN